MKNSVKIFGIIALVAVIGFGFTACGDDNGGGVQIPSRYRGTWQHSSQNEDLTITATTIRGHGNAHTARSLFNHPEGTIVNFGTTAAGPMVMLGINEGELWVEVIINPDEGIVAGPEGIVSGAYTRSE